MVLIQLEVSMQKYANLSILISCTKLNCKWIKDIHIKPDTLKLIEKKLGKTLGHMGTEENFLKRTPIAYAQRLRIDKWDLIKLLSVLQGKGHCQKDKMATNKLEKDLYQPYILYSANIQYIQRTKEIRLQRTE